MSSSQNINFLEQVLIAGAFVGNWHACSVVARRCVSVREFGLCRLESGAGVSVPYNQTIKRIIM